MAKGFGAPQYWLQICYRDAQDDVWKPVYSDRARARESAAREVQDVAVDFVLILSGDVREGSIAKRSQILDEFQAYAVPGAKVYRLSD